jgi:hypothetical protein
LIEASPLLVRLQNSRIGIERSKHLVVNPYLRVSEIAFEIGFQSLTSSRTPSTSRRTDAGNSS